MGNYGSGLTIGQACMQNKDIIRHALKCQVPSDAEEGYIPSTKQESDQLILHVYDDTVYQLVQANASGRAMERAIKELLEQAGVGYDDYIRKYLRYMEEESARFDDYLYEGDEELIKAERLSCFRVIPGKKPR